MTKERERAHRVVIVDFCGNCRGTGAGGMAFVKVLLSDTA